MIVKNKCVSGYWATSTTENMENLVDARQIVKTRNWYFPSLVLSSLVIGTEDFRVDGHGNSVPQPSKLRTPYRMRHASADYLVPAELRKLPPMSYLLIESIPFSM